MNICRCFEALVVIWKGSKVFAKDHKYAARSDIYSYVKFSKLVPKCLSSSYPHPQSILMASSTLKCFFINSNSSSSNLFKILKRENNLFKDLTLNKNNALSSLFFSFKHPTKVYKL